MNNKLRTINNSLLSFCIFSYIVRLLLIMYSIFHDRYFLLKYTDIDYAVFSDAALYLSKGLSPYLRSTYRYSPVISFLLLPNVFLFSFWGKSLFCLSDILIGLLIYAIQCQKRLNANLCLLCASTWLFNPIPAILSSRGSCDSLTAVLLLLCLYCLQNKPIYAGLAYALAVHFKLYPVIFSIALVNSLKLKDQAYVLNMNQLYFSLSAFCCFILLLISGYIIFGMPYLKEAIIYHINRKDIKHNFSIYFYYNYLNYNEYIGVKWLCFFPQALLIFLVSMKFGTSENIAFALFLISSIFVTFNKVITSQYFIWYLTILPIIMPNIHLKLSNLIILTSIWCVAQITWLLFAYLLEFHNINTFKFIWLASVFFFCSNVAIIGILIKNFKKNK